MQANLDTIAMWTENNLMQLNEAKCNYMVFSRSHTEFSTRLYINDKKMDRIEVTKLLGLWISEDLSWSKNCKEVCRKAFSRLSMITKLKYAGVRTEDLLDIYILFIRSITEYCAVAFHSSLTQEEANKIEMIQKACLRVILDDMYISYSAALEMTGLQTLYDRRQKRCLDFARKCVLHPINKRLFPLNPESSDHFLRRREIFKVNFASTSSYKKSAIPFCQRLLNDYCNGDT